MDNNLKEISLEPALGSVLFRSNPLLLDCGDTIERYHFPSLLVLKLNQTYTSHADDLRILIPHSMLERAPSPTFALHSPLIVPRVLITCAMCVSTLNRKNLLGMLGKGSQNERAMRCSMAVAYIEIPFSMLIISIQDCILFTLEIPNE